MQKALRPLCAGLTAMLGSSLYACGENDAGLENDREPLAPDGPSASETPQPTPEPLPDLVLDAAYLADTTVLDTVTVDNECLLAQRCVSGLGERRVVRFGSRMGNLGDADFILGAPGSDNALWTRNTCRDSFELPGFARYELIDRATGEQAAVGAKNGSCVADSERWIEESGTSCERYACGLQGISPGCADNYGAALECQWIDITDVPAGVYELVVTINADRRFVERDYGNDVVRVQLRLDASAVSVEP
jgi:hypothetical protein